MDKRLFVSQILTLCAIVTIGQDVVAAVPPIKIVNGTTADDGEFPYMVQIYAYGYYLCGGAIIDEEWILTAGHCFEKRPPGSIVFGTNKIGDVSINDPIDVHRYYQHPLYQRSANDIPWYDVGLLWLEKKIPFSDKAKPIRLPDSNEKIPFHIQGVLSGWGYTEPGTLYPVDYLQKIQLQLLTDQECTKKINDFTEIDSFNSTHNLCSDDYYTGECLGDSGSPYVINGTQYGIVSWWNKKCGIVPGAYSRITNPEYRDWIRNITNI